MVGLKRNFLIKKVTQREIDNAAKLWESTRSDVWRVKWYQLIRRWCEQKTKT